MKDMKIIIVLEVRLFRNSFVLGTKEAFFLFFLMKTGSLGFEDLFIYFR